MSFIVMTSFGAWLELALPRAHGKRYHPCFCFMPSFWNCKRRENPFRVNIKPNADIASFASANHEFETKHMNPEAYEGVHAGLA
jgi:hypothetical protein